MSQRPQIQDVTNFLIDFTALMLSVGTYTTRAVKCVDRIAKVYGYEVGLTIFSKHFTISVMDEVDNSIRRTYVKTIPNAAINFNLISELSALSWQICDEEMSFQKAIVEFGQISEVSPNKFLKTLLFVSLANSAFCRLFGGDIGSMGCVFVATLIGFYFKHLLTKLNINLKLQYIIISFFSSLIAYFGVYYGITKTSDVAIGSSILFLIPGVWFINSVIDILNDNILVGISRVIRTGILIVCIAVGVYMTLSICDVGILHV